MLFVEGRKVSRTRNASKRKTQSEQQDGAKRAQHWLLSTKQTNKQPNEQAHNQSSLRENHQTLSFNKSI
jgi:hypothetical protein